jgi:toxin HigB-1
MIKTFADKRTAGLFVNGRARGFPPDVARRAVRKLEYVDLATRLDDLKTPPGNRLHALRGDRQGQHAIATTISGVFASASWMVTPTTLKSVITH